MEGRTESSPGRALGRTEAAADWVCMPWAPRGRPAVAVEHVIAASRCLGEVGACRPSWGGPTGRLWGRTEQAAFSPKAWGPQWHPLPSLHWKADDGQEQCPQALGYQKFLSSMPVGLVCEQAGREMSGSETQDLKADDVSGTLRQDALSGGPVAKGGRRAQELEGAGV